MTVLIPVTALYAGLHGLLLMVLSGLVIRQRVKQHVDLGDGGNEAMLRAMRVQANFVEYVPLALLLLGVWELNGGPRLWMHVAGITLLVARLFHAWGISHASGPSIGRGVGVFGTWAVLLGLSVVNVFGFAAGVAH